MSLVGHWEEAKFPAGINLVQTMAPGWRQIVSEVALDLITIPAVSALPLLARTFNFFWMGKIIFRRLVLTLHFQVGELTKNFENLQCTLA